LYFRGDCPAAWKGMGRHQDRICTPLPMASSPYASRTGKAVMRGIASYLLWQILRWRRTIGGTSGPGWLYQDHDYRDVNKGAEQANGAGRLDLLSCGGLARAHVCWPFDLATGAADPADSVLLTAGPNGRRCDGTRHGGRRCFQGMVPARPEWVAASCHGWLLRLLGA